MNTGLHFITADGRYDLAAMMRAANRHARSGGVLHGDWTLRDAMQYALRSIWARAKGECAIYDVRAFRNVTVMRQVAVDTYLPVASITRR
jgi:hypothetical protein